MQFRFGPFCLDTDARQLLKGHESVRLSPKAFELLRLLVNNRPRAMSKLELAEAVGCSDEGLPRLINEVRGALGESVQHPRWLRTVHGHGYAFSADAPHQHTRTRFRISWQNYDIPLGDGEHFIGREPSVSVCLPVAVVSRRHARIVVADDDVTLQDLESKNGTYVGKARVNEPTLLRDGDEIRIGDLTLVFRTAGITPTKTY